MAIESGKGSKEKSAYIHRFLVEPELVGERGHGGRKAPAEAAERSGARQDRQGGRRCFSFGFFENRFASSLRLSCE